MWFWLIKITGEKNMGIQNFFRSLCSTLTQHKTSLDLQNIPHIYYDIPKKISMTTTLQRL
jgi:hypothetical protein